MNRTPKFDALAAAIVVMIFLGSADFSSFHRSLILLRTQVSAIGEIIEVMPHDHGGCRYRFIIGEKDYDDIGSDCSRETIGTKITVHYASLDPLLSTNEDPEQEFIRNLVGFIVATCLAPLFAGFLAYRRGLENVFFKRPVKN